MHQDVSTLSDPTDLTLIYISQRVRRILAPGCQARPVTELVNACFCVGRGPGGGQKKPASSTQTRATPPRLRLLRFFFHLSLWYIPLPHIRIFLIPTEVPVYRILQSPYCCRSSSLPSGVAVFFFCSHFPLWRPASPLPFEVPEYHLWRTPHHPGQSNGSAS